MIDVFVSYTTRGITTDDWVKNFCADLKKFFYATYSRDLNIWYAPKENGTGDNFRTQINQGLDEAMMLLMILEPAFLNSPETRYEVNKYTETREKQKELKHYFKVIHWRGDKELDLRNYIDSHLLATYLSKINSDSIEDELQRGSPEYINEIQKLTKAIRKRQKEQSRKNNAEKILRCLESISTTPKIYVTLGYSGLRDSRSVFINQLLKTIIRDTRLKNVKIIPDEFTVSLLSYDDLEELFFEENQYGKSCMEAMLNASTATVIPVMASIHAQAEEILQKISFQVKEIIQRENVIRNQSITILTEVPKEIYETADFFKTWDNPIYAAYENIKMMKDCDINSFIEAYTAHLKHLIGVPVDSRTPSQKSIYIIEHYNPCPAVDDAAQDKLNKEVQNKRELRTYIVNKKFLLIPYIDKTSKLDDAVKHHIDSLHKSDGIIIYRGLTEEYEWCLQQQSDTYNTLLCLDAENTRKKEKAVHLDPLQQPREPADYFYYNYDVIINHPSNEPPSDLDRFLWKIQPPSA